MAALPAGCGGGGGGGEVRPGDWNCPNCGDLVFARNPACRRCGTPKATVPIAPALGGCGDGAGGQMRPGDWNCPNCNDMQFARNTTCRRCGTPRPGPMSNGGGMAVYAGPPSVQQGQCVAFGGGCAVAAGGGGGGDMRPGDWNCPNCGDHQFGRNSQCRKCNTPRPGTEPAGFAGGAFLGGCGALLGGGGGKGGGGAPGQEMRPGDWHCPNCNDLVFAKNDACRRCGTPRTALLPIQANGAFQANGGGQEMRSGDWNCPNCGDHQFGRNSQCRKCNTPRPEAEVAGYAGPPGGGKPNNSQMKPGDWTCPQCGDMQFARNSACRLCGAARPEEEEDGRARSRSPRR